MVTFVENNYPSATGKLDLDPLTNKRVLNYSSTSKLDLRYMDFKNKLVNKNLTDMRTTSNGYRDIRP